MSVSSFLTEALNWAKQDENIRCMVLVGSQARGTARADSDVDLVVMADDPQVLIRDHTFAGRFGRIDKMETEDWGKVTSVRVFYKDGLEVEFGFTDPSWCSVPLDTGTLRTLTDGYRVMVDKENYFSNIDIKSRQSAGRKSGGAPKPAGRREKSTESSPETATQKAATRSTPDQKAAARRTTDQKSAVNKPLAHKSAVHKPVDQKAATRSTADQKAATRSTPDQKAAARRTTDQKPAAQTAARKSATQKVAAHKSAAQNTAASSTIACRSEKEMMELILDTARNDERVRAVVMNGSRTDPDAPKDRYQDYDIVYVVRDLKPFKKDHNWIDIFGERIILQMPEAMDLLPPCNDGSFNYQMLFTDGNRIDLTLIPVNKAGELRGKDSLTVNLLDKDGILPPAGEPNNSSYHIKPPTEKLYSDCCNEFWWVLQNVAKGICRDELPYAMRMFEYARDMLDQMVCWHIGGLNGYKVSAGKCGKYFKRYLSESQYKMYAETYSDAKYSKLWKAVFSMCGLFRETAKDVADQSGFVYPRLEDRGMTAYLKSIKEFPKQ